MRDLRTEPGHRGRVRPHPERRPDRHHRRHRRRGPHRGRRTGTGSGASEDADRGDRYAVQEAGPGRAVHPVDGDQHGEDGEPGCSADRGLAAPQDPERAAAETDPDADAQPERHRRARDVSLRQQPARQHHEQAAEDGEQEPGRAQTAGDPPRRGGAQPHGHSREDETGR